MQQHSSDSPRLRLVGASAPDVAVPAREQAARRRAEASVAAENRAASTLSPTDARWIVAVRVADALEGGRAGVLPPEKRQRLTNLATRLGLRPFDASLIMAIVQDGARSGEGALGHAVADRLKLVSAPPSREPVSRVTFGVHLAIGMALGVLATLALIRWVGG